MKKIFSILLLLVFTIILTGCFGKDKVKEDPIEATKNYTTELYLNTLSYTNEDDKYRFTVDRIDQTFGYSHIEERDVIGFKLHLEFLATTDKSVQMDLASGSIIREKDNEELSLDYTDPRSDMKLFKLEPNIPQDIVLASLTETDFVNEKYTILINVCRKQFKIHLYNKPYEELKDVKITVLGGPEKFEWNLKEGYFMDHMLHHEFEDKISYTDEYYFDKELTKKATNKYLFFKDATLYCKVKEIKNNEK